MSKTVLDFEEYIRSYSKALKDSNLPHGMIVSFLNNGKNKVQRDLMEINPNLFRRSAYLEGSLVSLPSDIMEIPDAIIDLKCSIGTVRPSYNFVFTGADNDILITARQPGTPNNTCSVAFVDGLTSGYSYQITYTSEYIWSIVINFSPGIVTNTLIAAINDDPAVSKLIIASSSEGTGLGTITLGVGVSNPLAGGVGTGYYPSDYLTLQEFNRHKSISLLTPTYKNPKYTLSGSYDSDRARLIEMFPRNITYSELDYYFSVPDVSDDTDTFKMPSYYDDLVLYDALHNCYDILLRDAEDEKKKVEYLKQIQSLEDGYKSRIGMKAADQEVQKGAQ